MKAGLSVAAALLLPLLSGCAAHRFVVPSGAGRAAPEGAGAIGEARGTCGSVTSFSAKLHVPGLPGGMDGAVTAADEIYLIYTAPFGRPGFVLSGRAADATLVFPGERRYVTARADDIVDALIGLRLSPAALMAMFDGCVSSTVDASIAVRYADTLAIGSERARVFLRQSQGHWQPVAGMVDGLLVHYRKFDRGWPRSLRITSMPGAAVALDLGIDFDQVSTNIVIPPKAFEARIPDGATRMTLDELRASKK